MIPRALVLASSLVLAAASARAAELVPAPTQAAAPELRDALRGFYVRALGRELELDDAKLEALRPKVEALLDAQRGTIRALFERASDVRRAAAGDGDPAAAVAAFERAEREGRDRATAARKAVLDSLDPRQQARFLAFEARFRERVRDIMTGGAVRASGASGPRREGDDGLDGGEVPPPRGPSGERRARGDANGGRPRGASGDEGGRGDLRQTMVLLFVDDVRRELQLDDERTLALLPRIRAVVEQRTASEGARRKSARALSDLAADPTATDASLSSLVASTLAAEKDAAEGAMRSRHELVASLSPTDAAKLLVVEQRFLSQLRQQLQAARALRRGGTNGP